MRTLVLREVVAARELLATVGALEGLLAGVERAVVTLEMFLTTEATVADGADEGVMARGEARKKSIGRLRLDQVIQAVMDVFTQRG